MSNATSYNYSIQICILKEDLERKNVLLILHLLKIGTKQNKTWKKKTERKKNKAKHKVKQNKIKTKQSKQKQNKNIKHKMK